VRWCLLALLHLSLCTASDFVMPGMAEQVFGLQSPQLVSQLQPSELEALGSMPQLGVNGLPFVPMDVAVNQFLQKEQQLELQMEQSQAVPGANEGQGVGQMDLERSKRKAPVPSKAKPEGSPYGFGVHTAVPKLQQWLTSMDPMAYASPTFTNPVAQQFFKKLSDPGTLPTQKNHMMQMVSSPYMFNMLGNPAFSDPQLWSGLVSGAAVPYPMRNMIFAQRTGLPAQLSRTGSAMTPTDEYAMGQYENAALENNSANNGFPSPEHATRHRLFKVLKNLQEKAKYQHTKLKPTPHDHDTMLSRFDINSDDVLDGQKKRRDERNDDDN